MKDSIFKYRLLKRKNILSIGNATTEFNMDIKQLNSIFNLGIPEQELTLDSVQGRKGIETFISDFDNIIKLETFFLEKNRKKL